jgi:phage terminase large subunit
MAFQMTTAVKKMLQLKKPIKVIQGATYSGKTYGIIPIFVDKCIAKKRKATIVAETRPAVKEGCVDLFKDFMVEEGRWRDEAWNESSLTYKFLNGSKLQFKSYDTVGKAKQAGKRDLLFLNEANTINFEIADALISRTDEEIWMDFNADMEFYAHTEILPQGNADFLKLTYLDNEGIPPQALQTLLIKRDKAFFNPLIEDEKMLFHPDNIKSLYWANYWKVYGLGGVGQLHEAVYELWDVVDEKPDRFQRYIYGLDFGFIHPTALIRIWYWEDELFLEEVIYQPGLTETPLIEKMESKGVEKHIEIVADYARPEMIAALRDAGFYVLNADKAVNKGINKLKEKKVFVHKDSVNIQTENRKYKYRKVSGVVIEDVLKKDDDAMDAIRYGNLWIDSYSIDGLSETLSLDI